MVLRQRYCVGQDAIEGTENIVDRILTFVSPTIEWRAKYLNRYEIGFNLPLLERYKDVKEEQGGECRSKRDFMKVFVLMVIANAGLIRGSILAIGIGISDLYTANLRLVSKHQKQPLEKLMLFVFSWR
ncbi:hypothetical protein Bca101_017022 [Brassica carinata]